MNPLELADACREIYGRYGWQTRLAEALKVDGSTVRRWVSGAIPVPGPVEAAVNCFLRESRRLRAEAERQSGQPSA